MWLAKKKVYSPLNLINHSLKQRLWNKLQIKCTFICLVFVFKLLLIGLCGVSTLLRLNRSCHVFECMDSLLILYFQYWPFELNLLVWCVVYRYVSLQRAAQQLKAQRQLEEAFESRLQRMQTNTQAQTLVSSDPPPSTDANISSGV